MMRGILVHEIQKAIKDLYPDITYPEILITRSPRSELGDYGVVVAFGLSSNVGKNPAIIAEEIKEELPKSENFNRCVSRVEAAGGGFLNLWLSEEGLAGGIRELEIIYDRRYLLTLGRGRKIQVEFISANPTGKLHIGNGRGGFYGDALSNILEAAGYKVDREYFINDAKASAQIKELGKTALGKGISYLTPYLESKINKIKLKLGKISDEGKAGHLLAKEIQKDNESFIEKKLGIGFDLWFSEEGLYKKSELTKTKNLLESKNAVYEQDGAFWLKTSQFGDERDRVIIRSDGTPTYFLSDTAYHARKFKKNYKAVIDIWGADHQGHVKTMLVVKDLMGWRGDFAILITQMVTIKEAGVKKKISKRKGDVILLEDLLKEVGLDVLRWFFLEKALSTQMEFDMKLAKERSKKNPVYYVQYAHARACSILRKAKWPARKSDFSSIGLAVGSLSKNKIKAREEKFELSQRALILKLIQFPEIVEDIAKDYQVHRLTTYVYELAKVFTDFYENVPVLKAETEELKKSRLALVFITRKILEKTLTLMGISAPEKM